MFIVVLSSFAGEGWKRDFSSHHLLCSVFHSPYRHPQNKISPISLFFGTLWPNLASSSFHVTSQIFPGFD
jgi:hypothetical protein